jgi:cbb3-type cytochrome oxidase subunit 3
VNGDSGYLVFGLALCGALVGIIAFYYSGRRKDGVERAKYEMLKDDDEPK